MDNSYLDSMASSTPKKRVDNGISSHSRTHRDQIGRGRYFDFTFLPLRRRWMWSLQKQRPRKSLPFLFSSLTEDLTFTVEHPTPYGSLPFLDVLFHTDKFYCFSEAPIKSMTYLYTKYSSCTSNQSRIIRSLTGRAVPTTSAPLST